MWPERTSDIALFASPSGRWCARVRSEFFRPDPAVRREISGGSMDDRDLSDVLSEFARTLATDFPIQGILLGLNIIESVAHNHGGEVCLVSAPGEGTTVTVTLPLLRCRAD